LDPPHGFYLRELRTGLDHTFSAWELEEQYQLGKTIGVRFCHPYWDPDLVKMLYRTPPRILNEGGRTKGLVRRTVARRFPALGLERQRKVTATSFYESLLRREGKALADAAGDFPALSKLGIVNGKATRSFVQEALGGRRGIQHCWPPINLEMWSRSNYG
jgi:hypothetical protein